MAAPPCTTGALSGTEVPRCCYCQAYSSGRLKILSSQKLLLCSLFWSLVLMHTPAAAHDEKLTLLWTVDGFHNPESVMYDPQTKVLFVSNVNGGANDKDGNGYISTVSLEGKILEQQWVRGLNAPKGLALYQGRLYTADIDTLVVIDIASATIEARYPVADAVFLNDVTASPDGDIFVSDMMTDRIHRLHKGRFETWLESAHLEAPNGLTIQGDYLYVGAWGVLEEGFDTKTPGHLKMVSLRDKSIHSVGPGTPLGNLDGLAPDRDGDFYVSDWMAGKVYHLDRNGAAKELLALEQGSSDLAYVPDRDLLLVPMMMGNKLMAWKAHASR